MHLRKFVMMMLATIGSVTLLASSLAGPLDDIAIRRMNCLNERIREQSSPGTTCLSRGQLTYMQSRREEFCTNPARFCETVLSTDTATYAEYRDKFVSPRCESPLPLCGDFNPSRQDRYENFLRCITPTRLGIGVMGEDKEFAAMIRRAWGCDQGRTEVRMGPSGGTEIVRRFSCDPDRLSFDCSTWAVKPGTSKSLKPRERILLDARARMAREAFIATGASLHLEQDRCVLETAVVSKLPLIRQGEPTTAYEARLTPSQRQELLSRDRQVQRRAESVFRTTGELLGDKSTRFQLWARGLVTEERVAIAEEAYRAARVGVLDFLRSLNPPPPRAILAAVENSQLMDLRSFLKKSPTENDKRIMQQIEETCHNDVLAFGDDTAYNNADPAGKSQIVLCPSTLLSAEATNPRKLITLLAHELGHSIDPCSISMLLPEVRVCERQPPPSITGLPEESNQLNAWTALINGPGGWSQCMTQPKERGWVTGVTFGNGAYHTKMAKAMIADGPRCLVPDEKTRCQLNHHLFEGPLQHCVRNLGNTHLDDRKCPTSHKLGTGYGPKPVTDMDTSKVREAFADFVSSRSVTKALNLYTPSFQAMPVVDRAAEFLTTLVDFCEGQGGSESSYPAGSDRVTIFSSSPELRESLGCSTLEKPTSIHPTAHCEELFKRR